MDSCSHDIMDNCGHAASSLPLDAAQGRRNGLGETESRTSSSHCGRAFKSDRRLTVSHRLKRQSRTVMDPRGRPVEVIVTHLAGQPGPGAPGVEGGAGKIANGSDESQTSDTRQRQVLDFSRSSLLRHCVTSSASACSDAALRARATGRGPLAGMETASHCSRPPKSAAHAEQGRIRPSER
jgi:hypothetical protein